MNVLILAAGNEKTNAEYPFCLSEFDGKPLIERVIASSNELEPVNVIVALRESDIRQYHLDNVVSLLIPESSILSIRGETSGAACTALLAAEELDNEDELLIVNGNELLDASFSKIIGGFRKNNADAGVVVFSSVHPRYSYVRLDNEQWVVEASEKNPISKNATAGFYWFRRGSDFVSAAKNMIRKDGNVNGLFYICPVFNELVLEQKKIAIHSIEPQLYHPLKSERQIEQYEARLERELSS